MDKEQLILDGGTIEEINAEMREFLDLDNDELYSNTENSNQDKTNNPKGT